jgi:hypothetical protein
MTPLNGLARAVALILLIGVITGCATSRADLVRSHFGVRPDEPEVKATGNTFCLEYQEYATYAQQLQEAYHSRATQNRWWIYAAGITGLGAAAASGALAAAATVTAGTLALLSISGGVAAGAFATVDNPDLAKLYTSAANSVDEARLTAEEERLKSATEDACRKALLALKKQVSEARKKLELGRTSSAAGALIRATAERDELDRLLDKEIEKRAKGRSGAPGQ